MVIVGRVRMMGETMREVSRETDTVSPCASAPSAHHLARRTLEKTQRQSGLSPLRIVRRAPLVRRNCSAIGVRSSDVVRGWSGWIGIRDLTRATLGEK